MSADFESFSDDDELWISEMETRAIDLENELSVWREAREQAQASQEYAEEPVPGPPHQSFRRVAGRPPARPREPVRTATRRTAGRSQARTAAGTFADDARTRALIDHGRSTARRSRFSRIQRRWSAGIHSFLQDVQLGAKQHESAQWRVLTAGWIGVA